MKDAPVLKVTSPAFADGGEIPIRHTGFGEDLSPAFTLDGLSPDAVTLAVTMDDLDIPFVGRLNHWLLWNVPPMDTLPEGIPHGEKVPSMGNAQQGVGYGRNAYRGPKQPVFVRNRHRYEFTVYALDSALTLPSTARKAELLAAMQGHVLQQGMIVGTYKRG